jgi:hypothetical protein
MEITLMSRLSYMVSVCFGRISAEAQTALQVGQGKLVERVTANNPTGEYYRAQEDLYYEHHARLNTDLFRVIGRRQVKPLIDALRAAIAAAIKESLQANFEIRMTKERLQVWRRHIGAAEPSAKELLNRGVIEQERYLYATGYLSALTATLKSTLRNDVRQYETIMDLASRLTNDLKQNMRLEMLAAVAGESRLAIRDRQELKASRMAASVGYETLTSRPAVRRNLGGLSYWPSFAVAAPR